MSLSQPVFAIACCERGGGAAGGIYLTGQSTKLINGFTTEKPTQQALKERMHFCRQQQRDKTKKQDMQFLGNISDYTSSIYTSTSALF